MKKSFILFLVLTTMVIISACLLVGCGPSIANDDATKEFLDKYQDVQVEDRLCYELEPSYIIGEMSKDYEFTHAEVEYSSDSPNVSFDWGENSTYYAYFKATNAPQDIVVNAHIFNRDKPKKFEDYKLTFHVKPFTEYPLEIINEHPYVRWNLSWDDKDVLVYHIRDSYRQGQYGEIVSSVRVEFNHKTGMVKYSSYYSKKNYGSEVSKEEYEFNYNTATKTVESEGQYYNIGHKLKDTEKLPKNFNNMIKYLRDVDHFYEKIGMEERSLHLPKYETDDELYEDIDPAQSIYIDYDNEYACLLSIDFEGSRDVIEIPKYYKGYIVKKIDISHRNDGEFKTLVIPENVKIIEPNSLDYLVFNKLIIKGEFDDCYGIASEAATFEEVSYEPTTSCDVSPYLFSGAESIKRVYLNGKVNCIKTNAFDGCSSLEYIDLTGVTKLEDSALGSCDSLTKVDLNDVKYISYTALASCKNLSKIFFHPVNITVEDRAFLYSYNACLYTDMKNAAEINANNNHFKYYWDEIDYHQNIGIVYNVSRTEFSIM